jgi:hypothetical protein
MLTDIKTQALLPSFVLLAKNALMAESVTDTEVKLNLPEKLTPKGHSIWH